MERTGDWFAERPLGIEGDAGQISDRGEPECFRPARKPPSAEDSYCGGEPNSALLLGPRIGQRLGEAGDREICRRGPGAARSAEPLRPRGWSATTGHLRQCSVLALDHTHRLVASGLRVGAGPNVEGHPVGAGEVVLRHGNLLARAAERALLA